MDLEIRAAYVKFDHETPKMIIRNDSPAVEDVGESYITFTAEDMEHDDVNNLTAQCWEYYDQVGDFLDATGGESDLKEYFRDEIEDEFLGDYSASNVISEWDGSYERFREFGNELRLSPSMGDELGEMLHAIGLEKIKEVFNIKMVIHHQEQTHEEGQAARS